MYADSLSDLKVEVPKRVNTTRLKERIMKIIPDLEEHNVFGNRVNLMFKHDVDRIIQDSNYNDEDIIHLVRASQIVRKEMFTSQYVFPGTFEHECEEDSVPQTLRTRIRMLLEDPSLVERSTRSQKALSIAQLVIYNSVKKSKSSANPNLYTRHMKD